MEATTAPSAGVENTGSKTVADLIPLGAKKFADRPVVRYKRDGDWVDVTYAEVGEIVSEVARGLMDLGLEKGDRVSILCNTRPEWTYADFGISTAGGTVVPIYPTNSPEECQWVAGNSESRMVVCEDASQVAKIVEVRNQLPTLTTIIVIDPAGDVADAVSLEDVRERGRGVDKAALAERSASVTPEDTYTIIYTSGTTGPPKGCVLSHRNYRSVMDSCEDLDVFQPDDVVYLFLPLAHAFALLIQLLYFDVGGTIAYYGGDPQKIVPELQEVKPTYFPSVPRIFEKIYTMAAPAIKEKVGEEQFAQMVALGVKVRDLEYNGQEVPAELREKFNPIDQQVFANVRGIFGGRLREAVTGAAPIGKEILEFFYAAGLAVLEGFGMTETSTAATFSTKQHHKFGTVGRALPSVEIKIAEDGEILVKGGNIFEGYYKNDDATFGTVVDGWLHTGDLGSLDEDGYLSITGRKKDIIITAGGKNLTPANLENDMKQCRYVSQAVMHGDRRPFPSMLITLDPEEIAAWAKENGKAEDIPVLAKDPDGIALIQDWLDKSNAKYAQVEQVKKFFILDHDLSQETGELTPTMKVKRNVVNEKYEKDFDALYEA